MMRSGVIDQVWQSLAWLGDQLYTRTTSPPKTEAMGRALIIYDLDNLEAYLEQRTLCGVSLNVLSDLILEAAGISQPEVGICVFTTENGYVCETNVTIESPERFCIHRFARPLGEPGYVDDEMYKTAWHHLGSYETIIYVSNDNDIARILTEHRRGFNRFIAAQHDSWVRKGIQVAAAWGHTEAWLQAAAPIDLDGILRRLAQPIPLTTGH